MQIRYYKEYSRYLNRDMEFKVYGHAGRPILIFPCHSRVYPTAVAVECVGYIDDRLLSTDALLDKNLFGKEKIFLGGSGFAFRENALGIQSFFNQIIPHSLAFRHRSHQRLW